MGFLKGDTTDDDKDITHALLRLRRRLTHELTPEYFAKTPKLAWITVSSCQCLIRRTLEAADGMRLAWNAGNLLTAITMARSLIETAAVVRRLTDSVKDATEKKDIDRLDRIVMSTAFGSKTGGEYTAQNILTTIEKMDKSLFRDNQPHLLSAHAALSEFVHPNHAGIFGLYSDVSQDEYRIEYRRTARTNELVLPHLRVTLRMIPLVDNSAADIDEFMPRLLELLRK